MISASVWSAVAFACIPSNLVLSVAAGIVASLPVSEFIDTVVPVVVVDKLVPEPPPAAGLNTALPVVVSFVSTYSFVALATSIMLFKAVCLFATSDKLLALASLASKAVC